MPAPKVPKLDRVVEKFDTRVRGAPPFWEAGVRDPRADWFDQFEDAKEARNAGLQEAISDGRIDKGAEKLGTAGWQRKTLEKGADRYRSIVAKLRDPYKEGWSPYHEELPKIVLEPRRRRGDPANVTGRVTPIATRFHQLRLKLLGVGGT